jgi:biotin synthase
MTIEPTEAGAALAREMPISPASGARPARSVLSAAADALLDEKRLLDHGELRSLALVPDDAIPALAALAHEVRLAWRGPTVEVEGILSAKTGGCPEDCAFCSQSSRFDSPVKATPFLDTDEVLAAAEETASLGASEFCIVLAVRGPDERTLGRIIELVPLVGARTGLNVAVSAGILTDDQAGRLAAAGVLLGMGESDEQRLELLGQLRELDPAEVPVNFLNPRPGTPLAERPIVGAMDALRWIALFRLALPEVILRYAGGREVTLGQLQAMGMTAGINALIVGNYLTTLGRPPEEDLRMLADLRMPIGALSPVI